MIFLKLDDTKNTKEKETIRYCLVTSNSTENAEKIKECCVSKRSKNKKFDGQDGYSVPLYDTNKYQECTSKIFW